jgi:hypothetical protein
MGVFERAARITAEECDCDWIGEIEPKSPLRALDKYLWYKVGGETAPVFRDPCRVLRQLGLPCVIGHCR